MSRSAHGALVETRLSGLGTTPAALLLAAALVLPLGACRQAGEATAEAAIAAASGRKVDIQRDGDRTVIKAGEGEISMSAGEALPLPADFPKDVYLPKAYTVNSVMDMSGMRVVSVMSPGKVSGLFNDARTAMQDAGWKQNMAMQQSADNAMLSFEKAQRNAVLSFNRAQSGRDGVVISVQLRQEQQ